MPALPCHVAQAATVLGFLCVACTVRAQDPFEIQVYDATANPPGVPGLELHLNDWLTGHGEAPFPQAPLEGQFHATFEPSLGVFPFWEIGAYVQFALGGALGVFDWAGTKLRSKFVTPPGWHSNLRLGVNFEVSYLPANFDRDVWGSEVRPIVAWQNDDWLFAFNPIVDQSLSGPDAPAGPAFDPALKIARFVGPVGLGIEYYGNIEPIASPPPWRQQDHYLFEVLDVVSVPHFELNVGIGEGLTATSAGMICKAIVGYEFETRETKSLAAPSNPMRQIDAERWRQGP